MNWPSQQIISDQGPQFAAKLIQEFWKKLGVKSSLSTTFHPQTSVKREINPKRAEGRKVLESTRKCWNHQNFILPVSSRFGVLKSHM